MQHDPLILVLNAGSSSQKVTVYSGDRVELRATVERTQQHSPQSTYRIEDGNGRELAYRNNSITDRSSLLPCVLDILAQRWPDQPLAGVGHRVVHGGAHFTAPVLVTPTVLTQLEALIPLAPLHQPHNILGIQAAARLLPGVPQVACFDTAFHATMPQYERMFGLPQQYFDQGVQRYGFHGLSYESIAARLPQIDPRAATGRTVVCHLGSGASLCALLAGKSVATTMSFTPLDGLLMGTRAGAIDPGVLLYLLRTAGLTTDQLEHLLDRESGLLGVSGLSADMRDLLASPEPAAATAVHLFCYRIVRDIGAMVAALEGLDALVFTAGIGEHSPEIRAQVCRRLAWLGVQLDPAANQAGVQRLNTAESRVSVLCIPADEAAVIARHTARYITTAHH